MKILFGFALVSYGRAKENELFQDDSWDESPEESYVSLEIKRNSIAMLTFLDQ